MPAFKNHTGAFGLPNDRKGIPIVRGYYDGNTPAHPEFNRFITGVTRDSVGAALASCTVYVFRADMLATKAPIIDSNCCKPFLDATELRPTVTYVWTGVSDGSGNFIAGPFSGNSGSYFAVAWNASGTVAGVTLNTLVPA